MATDLPYLDLRTPSTTSGSETARIRRAAGRRRAQWRVAPPLRLFRHYGRRAPVSITLTPRVNAETWIEVSDHRGRFWIRHDASVLDLVMKLQEGGYYVQPAPSTTSPRRSARAAGSENRSHST